MADIQKLDVSTNGLFHFTDGVTLLDAQRMNGFAAKINEIIDAISSKDYTQYIATGYPKNLLNPNFTFVITDGQNRILYGVYTDGSLYQPNLSGLVASDGTSISAIVNALK